MREHPSRDCFGAVAIFHCFLPCMINHIYFLYFIVGVGGLKRGGERGVCGGGGGGGGGVEGAGERKGHCCERKVFF